MAGQGLTEQEKTEWWELYDDLPPTTRERGTCKRLKTKHKKISGLSLPPAAASPLKGTHANGVDQQKQHAADCRFRRKIERLERCRLEQATKLKSDEELLRIFAEINAAWHDGKRQRRPNRAIASFIRLRSHNRSYDYRCRGCHRVRDKPSCKCYSFTSTAAAIDEAPQAAITTAPTAVAECLQTCESESDLGVSDWANENEVANTFVKYLKGPTQEITNQQTIKSHKKQFLIYFRWHRQLHKQAGTKTIAQQLANQVLVANYMSTELSDKAKETFSKLNALVCRWLKSGDPSRSLQEADDLMRAQHRKRQKRQQEAKKKKGSQLPPGLLTKQACDAFRILVVVTMNNKIDGVIKRIEDGTTSSGDRLFMSTFVPTVIVTLGKPLRPCDLQSLTLSDAATLAEGTPLAVEEQKSSCKHDFTYVPTNLYIQRCLKIYTNRFRPFLCRGSCTCTCTCTCTCPCGGLVARPTSLSTHGGKTA